MYRDRLIEAFLPDHDSVDCNQWRMAKVRITQRWISSAKRLMSDPILINTNLVLSDSLVSKYYSRGGDSFVLSPHFQAQMLLVGENLRLAAQTKN